MHRLLMVIGLCCSLVPASAGAATPHRPVPDFAKSEAPKIFEESMINAIFAERGEKVLRIEFVKEFTPGGTRDATARVPGRHKYYLGTSDLERFEQTRRKVSQMNNWSIGVARANWLWAENNYEGEVLPMTIMNHHARGVYVILTEPIIATVPTRPQRIEAPLQPLEHELRIRELERRGLWLRPSLGAGLITMDPLGFATPVVGLAGGYRFGQTDVGFYTLQGQDFQPDLRGLCRYGLQLGDELGWAFRLGYQSDWTELRGDGHTDRRREGGEVGVTYGTSVLSVSGYFGLGWYADRRDRDGQLEPSLGLALNLGPVFRSGK